MSIMERMSEHGAEVVRNEFRFTIKRGRLSASALEWLGEPANRAQLMREAWPDYDDWEERAAIREYCGGMSRQDAEKAAYEDIMRRAQC